MTPEQRDELNDLGNNKAAQRDMDAVAKDHDDLVDMLRVELTRLRIDRDNWYGDAQEMGRMLAHARLEIDRLRKVLEAAREWAAATPAATPPYHQSARYDAERLLREALTEYDKAAPKRNDPELHELRAELDAWKSTASAVQNELALTQEFLREAKEQLRSIEEEAADGK